MLFDQIVVLGVLLLLSGFFSSAETALFSISKAKAVHIAKEKGLRNALIKKMKDDPHRLLSTILIGNNLVNVGASALATAVTINLVSSNAVGIATARKDLGVEPVPTTQMILDEAKEFLTFIEDVV